MRERLARALAALLLCGCPAPPPALPMTDLTADVSAAPDVLADVAPDVDAAGPAPCGPGPSPAGTVRARPLVDGCPEDLPQGLFVTARGGDLVLENAAARFVVRAGLEGHAVMGLTGGHLVDAVALSPDGSQRGADALREYVPTADFHLVDPDSVIVTADGADGEARVEVSGELVPFETLIAVVPFSEPPVTFRHVYVLAPDSPVLEIRTDLVATDPDGASFTPTDMMFWSGAVQLYLPGISPAEVPTSAPAPLVGLQPTDPSHVPAFAVSATTPRDLVNFGPVTGFLHTIPAVGPEGLELTRYLAVAADGDVEAAIDLAAAAVGASWDGLSPSTETSEVHVTVTGPDGAPVPFRLTARRLVDGDKETHYLVDADGDATFELPLGTWDAWVTHGTTWSWHPTTIDVLPGQTTTLSATLDPVVDTTGWIAADLHVHAEQSPDSVIPTTRRLQAGVAEGLDYLVITEHDFVADPAAFMAPAGLTDELVIARGVEVSTMHLGHFNTWPRTPDPDSAGAGAPVWYDLDHATLFDTLQEVPAAFVQCNHPRFGSGYAAFFDVIGLDGSPGPDALVQRCDAVEIVNGFGHEDTTQVLQDWLGLLDRGVRVTATGTSDTHEHDDFAGNARTWVRLVDGATPGSWTSGDVDAALRAGAAVATAGPILTLTVSDGTTTAAIGETLVSPSADLTAHVTLQAPTWMTLGQLDLIVDGEVAHSEDTSALPVVDGRQLLTLDLPLSFDQPGYVLAFHQGPSASWPGTHRPPWALTNPVFVQP